MPETSTRSKLDHLAFTEGLEPSFLGRLAEIATPVSWDTDAVIYREADPKSPLYLVETGHVAIEAIGPAQRRLTILTVGLGEVFGWSSLCDRRPKTASARALEPTAALAFDTDRLRALCDADPALGYALMQRILRAVAERLKSSRLQMLDVFGG